MYTPFLAQQQQAGQQLQQISNNAGSGVGAGIGAPPAGAQPSTLAMAQQNLLQSGTQLTRLHAAGPVSSSVCQHARSAPCSSQQWRSRCVIIYEISLASFLPSGLFCI